MGSYVRPAMRQAVIRLDRKRLALMRAILAELTAGRRLDSCCDDLDWPDDFTDEDKRAMLLDYHTWNGDPEEAETFDTIGFSPAFSYLTAALLKHAEETI